MKKLTELARLVSQLEELTSACKKCGACQSVCPIFEQTGMEKDFARGKIAVLDGVMEQVVSNSGAVLQRLDNCLLCGSCQTVCPNRVESLRIFFSAKKILADYKGLSPAKKFLFRQILAKPYVFNSVLSIGSLMQGLVLKKQGAAPGTRAPRFPASLILEGRHVPPLAQVPFHKQKTAESLKIGLPGENSSRDTKRALFFTGCLIDKIFPDIAKTSVEVLKARGFTPVILEDECCCGIPALSSGDHEAFTQMVRHNLAQMSKLRFDILVTACATCAFTIKKAWPMMWDKADSDYEKIEAVANKTADITQLLGGALVNKKTVSNQNAVPVTYHDPCHLKKSLGVSEEPRALINANPDCRLVEMAAPDACCGMGGGFGVTHLQMSAAIGASKLQSILDTGSKIVATTCPACMIQIAGLLSKAGHKDISVCHVIELYAKAAPFAHAVSQ